MIRLNVLQRTATLLLPVALGVLASGWPAMAHAAPKDAPRSRDHPLVTRMPNSYIAEYRQSPFDGAEFRVPGEPKQVQRVEGKTTSLYYFYNDKATEQSPLAVIRNYQNAVKSIGGQVVYERVPQDADAGETTLRVNAGGKDVWIQVEPVIFSAPTHSYKLTLVEAQPMEQVVSASRMLDALNKDGFIALHINFDTGKADLKADGQATVKEIIALLKAQPALKLAIEGHTDNVGNAASNKALSEARARSVVTAAVAGGVAATRLSAAGYGTERPVADNRGEEGRAKNRRVELVRR